MPRLLQRTADALRIKPRPFGVGFPMTTPEPQGRAPAAPENTVFRTIVIGIDGRPQDAEVLALAQRLADPGAEIIAASIAIIDPAPLRTPSEGSQAKLLAAAEDAIDTFIEPYESIEGVPAAAASIGRGLADVAFGAGADLIVVASSRRGIVGRVFAGEAVRDVLRHAPCPVAVATVGNTKSGPLRTITVGYDGSAESDAALELAVGLGRRDAASVGVVEVIEPTIALASAAAGPYSGVPVDAGYQRAQEDLDRLAKRYQLKGVIAVGRAAHELAEASRASDLLAIGLHNYGLLDRLIVGSTAHALLREQSAPILFSPPAPHPGETGQGTTTSARAPGGTRAEGE
jgi:nucleotide-binding universal stress UspA family protein